MPLLFCPWDRRHWKITEETQKITRYSRNLSMDFYGYICGLLAKSCPTLCDPIDYTVHGILQARILEWVAFPFSGDIPNPGIERRSPTLQADSLPAESQGKPKNTEVGSLSLFQQIFPTQESNHSLLHCRRILYQLSYKGNLDSVLKSRDITLPTKVHVVKAMVFQ